MNSYNEELNKAMVLLSNKPNTLFLGQSLKYGGIAIANSFKDVPDSKKLEMPVAENLQLGISTGLALEGFVPITVYPRWNFLILASDQLVNHLDKLVDMTNGAYRPKVIIRVASGVRTPVDPQEQHVGDFSDGFSKILKNVKIIKLRKAEDIVPAYLEAYESEHSTILVEEHQF